MDARELTKKFEEYIRGNISVVLEDRENLKGEMVVVVEGNTDSETELDEGALFEEIVSLSGCGKTNKEIVALLCDKYNLKKNYVYDLVCNYKR